MAHRAVLWLCPKTVWHCIVLAGFQVQRKYEHRNSSQGKWGQRGESFLNTLGWPLQLPLLGRRHVPSQCPTAAPEKQFLTPTQPPKKLQVFTAFFSTGTPLQDTVPPSDPLPPWHSVSLPSCPGAAAFLTVRRWRWLWPGWSFAPGHWQEAYTHSCPTLPFLQPLCQLINCQLLGPTSLGTALLAHFKVVQKSSTRPSPAQGEWCHSWTPTAHFSVWGPLGRAPGSNHPFLVKEKSSTKGAHFQELSSVPFHESYIRYAAGFGGCWLGFFNVGTGFLFPAPQTNLFHIIK